jgi:hypothetical protein
MILRLIENIKQYIKFKISGAAYYKLHLKQMNTYMKKYLITYWTQRNDESTDVELELYAYNEIDAMRKFHDMNIVHRKIESVEEMV